MEYIAHRINTIAELKKLPEEYGVELDLRDDLNGRIYISHNPFEAGEDFEAYCKEYRHGTMILNIKSERIEHEVLTLMEKYTTPDMRESLDSRNSSINIQNGESDFGRFYSMNVPFQVTLECCDASGPEGDVTVVTLSFEKAGL